MDDKEIVFLIISASVTVLLISVGLIVFLAFFIQTKKRNMKERFRLMEEYRNELYTTQIEIKDQTLKHVGRELHDNIGQLLIVARIHLKTLLKTGEQDKLAEINEITGRALDELRKLSRSLNNGDRVKDSSLLQLVQQEVAMIDKTGVIRTDLRALGTEYRFDRNHELIVYRILQEFVSNALKYSGSEHIFFELSYQPGWFSFTLKDDGKGFDPDRVAKGSGLANIENRARMIGAQYSLDSAPGRGTSIHLKLKTADVSA
jgi:signal transduction histidine kinase